MSTMFSLPVPVVVDTDGSPLMGAQLTFTESGTSTPKTIYSDVGLTTPLSNPLTSDAFGAFTPVWLGDGLYTVALTDANAVQRWSVDSVGRATYTEAMTGISLALRGLAYSYDAFAVSGTGVVSLGNGAAAADVTLSRSADNVLSLGAGDSLALDGTWNGGTLRLGAYYLWVDGSGRLRIKSSAPTGHEDGAVVGDQVGPARVTAGALAITGYAPTIAVA